jgi:seryl-tRNA synthetase
MGKSEVAAILKLDEVVRAAILKKGAAEQARNAKSKEIGKAKASKDEALAASLMAEVAAAKETIESAGAEEAEATKARDDLLARLPNVPHESVPEGADEHGNKEVRRHGEPRKFNYAPRDHADIGEKLGMMDFEAAARMSGARFVVLKGQLARMERALAAFMLDVQTGENGYVEHAAPLLVRDRCGVRHGPAAEVRGGPFRFARKAERRGDRFAAWISHLIPTAEVSLTNIYREQIVDAASLPARMTAATPCFRSEAGSAGRDTKGMIRMHQFIKVELVSITKPEDSEAEHERMTKCAEGILERLELPYRTVLLCTGDMGFGAVKTYDLEVWLPSQNTYREISSCSNCGDFQARRMDAKFRRAPVGAEKAASRSSCTR